MYENFTLILRKILNSGPGSRLLLNDAKKMGKTNYKISCMYTFNYHLCLPFFQMVPW
jgi:hypothetical protein